MEIENKRKLMIAKSHASTAGNLKLYASASNKLARHYFEEDNFESALSECMDELEANKELKDRLKTALCHRMISEIHLQFCEFSKAADHAKEFYQLSKEEENVVEQQRAVLTLGRIFFTQASTLLTEDSDCNEGHALAKKSEEMLNKSLRLITRIKNVSKKEIQEMIAVALLNIGLNYELQQRSDEALKKFESATSVCVKYDIHDTLYNCYISLGAFHTNLLDYNKAINYLSLSISTAERLSDKDEKIANSRIDKAKIYFKMGEHLQAQNELTRAKKLRIGSDSLKSEIKLNLKRANTLCRLQRDLQRTPLDDYPRRKTLFEHTGDILSSMALYDQALAAYENMLASAESAGETGKQLLPAFVSLAATYMDDGQYVLAAEFYRRELQEIGDNAEEACRTSLNLGQALEKAKAPYHEIAEHYDNAKQLARRVGNTRLVANALTHLIDLQTAEKLDGLAADSRRELADLSEPSDSEEEMSQERDTQDVDLDSSDCADGADGELTPRAERTRGRTLKVTRNEKGETPLHRACIDGNLARARSLLDQGHPVNVRDNAGWLPLHEACSFDRVEIAELLLDRGAWIDDPGDAHCDGVTPLIDACCNGHLDTARLLIERGANLLTRNTNGETALDNLLGWFNRAQKSALSQEFITAFQQIEDKLRKAYVKAGVSNEDLPRKSIESTSSTRRPHPHPEKPRKPDMPTQPVKRTSTESAATQSRKKPRHVGAMRNRLDSSESDDEHDAYRPISPHDEREVSRMQRHELLSLEDDDGLLTPPRMRSSDRTGPAAEDYATAMENVRHRVHEPAPARVMMPEDRPALVAEDEVVDDWLDDDMGINNPKRRKVDSRIGRDFLGQQQKSTNHRPRLRLSSSSRNLLPKPATSARIRLTSSSSDEDMLPQTLTRAPSVAPSPVKAIPSEVINLDNDFDDIVVNSPTKLQRSRLQQPSLLTSNFGFSRKVSDRSRSHYEPLHVRPDPKEAKSVPLIAPPAQNLVQNSGHSPEQSRAVKIRIEGTLFLVPVLPGQTIGALAQEAAKRYFNIHGVKPSLSLVTKDGALLAQEDPVSLIVGADEVSSTVESWNMPPLLERYHDACGFLRNEPNNQIPNRLESGCARYELALGDLALGSCGLAPVFRAVHTQDRLVRLDLTGNMLRDDGMKLLADALHKLANLEDLLIGSNFITDVGLIHLSNAFVNSTTLAQKLKLLDLSHNSMHGKQTLSALAEILDRISLQSLTLRSCLLTADMFNCSATTMPRLLNLDSIESLDISFNRLGREGVAFFVGRLNSEHLTNLNVGAMAQSGAVDSEIARELVLFFEREVPNNLRSLDISRNQVNDDDISNLVRVLDNSLKLEALNLSGNDIGGESMEILLGRESSIPCLNVTGCPKISSLVSNGWMLEENLRQLKALTVSVTDGNCSRDLERTWRNVWRERAVCRMGPFGFLCLSVKQ